MSEEIKDIAPEFLRITYEISMNESSDIVMLHSVAEQLQPGSFDRSDYEYVNNLSKIAIYLGTKGFLRRQSSDWSMFSITREGIAEVEGTNKQAAGSIFNIYGSVQGSVIGTHNNAELTNTFNIGEFDRAIDELGSADKAELRELKEQLQQLMEQEDTVHRGIWAKFADVLQRHPWAINFVGRAAAGWLTQQAELPPMP